MQIIQSQDLAVVNQKIRADKKAGGADYQDDESDGNLHDVIEVFHFFGFFRIGKLDGKDRICHAFIA